MQQGKRLTTYITFVSYFSKKEPPSPPHYKNGTGKKLFTFSTGFWPPQFSAYLWPALTEFFLPSWKRSHVIQHVTFLFDLHYAYSIGTQFTVLLDESRLQRKKRMELLAKPAKLIFACSNIHKSTAGKVLTLSPAKLREENYFQKTHSKQINHVHFQISYKWHLW